MDLEASIAAREQSLIQQLKSTQLAINDPNGKGATTEILVEKQLLRPNFPPGFDCCKGAILDGPDAQQQSGAIDRIIYDRRVSPPLVFEEAHSIFPIENVAGGIEITVHMDATKLRNDVEQLRGMRAMRDRRFLIPAEGANTVSRVTVRRPGPRAFIVGLPADENWKPQTIANAFRSAQDDKETLIHGLYLLGIGFFETRHQRPQDPEPSPITVSAWLGPDRLFRFTDALRTSLDRWPASGEAWTADLSGYLQGGPQEF